MLKFAEGFASVPIRLINVSCDSGFWFLCLIYLTYLHVDSWLVKVLCVSILMICGY